MSRYGWSTGSREQASPYSSMTGGVVTDEDFSYITSQDLDDQSLGVPADSRYHGRPHSTGPRDVEDDVLLIKNKGVTYPTHFPAYSIGDGKLLVKDVKERVGVIMDLSSRGTRRVKLLYKGRQLKEPNLPVREYGVKNKSELMAVLPEMHDASSPSEEEMVIVSDADRKESKSKSRRKRDQKKEKKKANAAQSPDLDSASSPPSSTPRDSSSTFDPPKSPQPAAASGPMKKLDELNSLFNTKWLPLCVQYTASPPSEAKAREDEHRKISESVLQQVLLALDGVDAEGNPEVRTRRRALVKQVQEVLKQLDAAKAGRA